jgi:hypothetical protein
MLILSNFIERCNFALWILPIQFFFSSILASLEFQKFQSHDTKVMSKDKKSQHRSYIRNICRANVVWPKGLVPFFFYWRLYCCWKKELSHSCVELNCFFEFHKKFLTLADIFVCSLDLKIKQSRLTRLDYFAEHV